MIGVIGKWAAGLFLLVNLWASFSVLHDHGLDVPALLLISAILLLCFLQWGQRVSNFCFFLGVSFPVWCYQSYTFNSQIFEYLVVFLGIVLWARLVGRGKVARPLPSGFLVLLVFPVCLALLSLALFPVASFLRLLFLWGWGDFSSAVLSATPENPLYAVADVDRLLLFLCVILLLAAQDNARVLYRNLLLGAAAGALAAVLLGILNQAGWIDLSWLRGQFRAPSGVPRLHSVAGNPGWFAQYLLAALPLVLLVRPGRRHRFLRVAGFIVLFSLAAVALLLTGSRTGWLLFPVVVLLCCLAALLKRNGSVVPTGWREHRGAMRRVGLLVLVGLLTTGIVSTLAYRQMSPVTAQPDSRTRYIMQRLRHILTPGERSKVWRETLILVEESPVFGLGYHGYKWHQQVMNSIPSSRFATGRQASADWDTPHSFFLQLVVDNGLVGLFLWLLPIVAAFALLWCDFRINRHAAVLPVMISLLALLLYGLTQSIQYIPLVWFLFFLFLGYAMTVEKQDVPGLLRQGASWPLLFPLLLVGAGGWFYVTHSGSGYLASRYGVTRYSLDRGEIRYQGFFSREDWGTDGIYHWSGPRSEMLIPARGLFTLSFVCNTPGLTSAPLVLDVTLDGQPIDRYTFWQGGRLTRTYWLQNSGADIATIRFVVSRTWNPFLAGQGRDTRNLGVAVSEPRFLGDSLRRETGFSEPQVEGASPGRHIWFRWTGLSAVMNPAGHGETPLRLLLRARRPYLAAHPLLVRFVQDQRQVYVARIADSAWTEVRLPTALRRDRPLRMSVDRGWNARRQGYGDDGHDRGVAVSFLPAGPGTVH